MKTGCYTALITPFNGEMVDVGGIEKLVSFQIQSGITGVLAVGTTAQTPIWRSRQGRFRSPAAHG